MYSELYEAWKREVDLVELGRLSSDFYSRIADYLRRLKEESRMLDKRAVKASLLQKEMQHAKRMVDELIQARYRKIIAKTAEGEKVPSGFLTMDEEKLQKGVLPFAEAYHSFGEHILCGYVSKVDFQQKEKYAVLRLLKEVPAIIGADMKTYGPFRVEDIASLPGENAKILVRKGLAQEIQV